MKTHTIGYNGTDYDFIIEHDVDGFFWTNDWSESTGFFSAQSEALASAIIWVKTREQETADELEAAADARSYAASVEADYRNAVHLGAV